MKDTRTTCTIKNVESEKHESDEEEFKIGSDSDSEAISDMDTKRRQANKNSHLFDPEKQKTKYNKKSLPDKIPIVEISE